MKSDFFMPIYLNKGLLLDLYSFFINGTIESTSVRFSRDNAELLKLQKLNKRGEACGEKLSGSKVIPSLERECNFTEECSGFSNNEFLGNVEGRNTNRNEITLKKISTNFSIFNNLKNTMLKDNMFRKITAENIINEEVQCGEYVEFNSCMSSTCLLNDVNNLIDILECYDCKELDKLITDIPCTNYSVILKQLKLLSSYLCKNNTINMVMDMGQCRAVLNVNLNYFSDKNSYVYDTCDTDCRVFGKVIKTPVNNENICLLSKTGMVNYYREFLDYLQPYLEILNENNIITPKNFIIDVESPAIQVIPIAMYL